MIAVSAKRYVIHSPTYYVMQLKVCGWLHFVLEISYNVLQKAVKRKVNFEQSKKRQERLKTIRKEETAETWVLVVDTDLDEEHMFILKEETCLLDGSRRKSLIHFLSRKWAKKMGLYIYWLGFKTRWVLECVRLISFCLQHLCDSRLISLECKANIIYKMQ